MTWYGVLIADQGLKDHPVPYYYAIPGHKSEHRCYVLLNGQVSKACTLSDSLAHGSVLTPSLLRNDSSDLSDTLARRLSYADNVTFASQK